MLIGTGRFSRTEQLIRHVAMKISAAEVIAALDRPPERVQIDGWDTIGARMEDRKRYLHGDRAGREWQAVILGLRNDTGVKGLHVETLFTLSDESRPQSQPAYCHSDLQFREQKRMLATQPRLPDADYVTTDTTPLRLSGLDDLFALEVGQPESWSDRRACNQDLAAAAILLRYHQAVERHAMTDGLPSALPLYATVRPVQWPMESNVTNFGQVASRRLTPVVGDFASRTAELLAEASRARGAEFIRETRRIVSQMREADAALALWPVWHNPFRRHEFAKSVELDRKVTREGLRRMHGVYTVASGEALIRRFVQARHGQVTAEILEELPAQDRSEVHQVKIAFAKKFGGPRVRAFLLAHPDRPAILDEIGSS